jgi:hypothetical protein
MVLLGLPGGFELEMVPLGMVLGLAKHLLRSRVLFVYVLLALGASAVIGHRP